MQGSVPYHAPGHPSSLRRTIPLRPANETKQIIYTLDCNIFSTRSRNAFRNPRSEFSNAEGEFSNAEDGFSNAESGFSNAENGFGNSKNGFSYAKNCLSTLILLCKGSEQEKGRCEKARHRQKIQKLLKRWKVEEKNKIC